MWLFAFCFFAFWGGGKGESLRDLFGEFVFFSSSLLIWETNEITSLQAFSCKASVPSSLLSPYHCSSFLHSFLSLFFSFSIFPFFFFFPFLFLSPFYLFSFLSPSSTLYVTTTALYLIINPNPNLTQSRYLLTHTINL